MRTGLITFHFAHHYGAQLQALATMRAIQSLGHDCEIIDYRLPHTTRTNQLFKKSGGVRGMASDAHTALHYGAFQRRFRRFEAFVAEEMSLSPSGTPPSSSSGPTRPPTTCMWRAATRSGTPISSRTSSSTPLPAGLRPGGPPHRLRPQPGSA